MVAILSAVSLLTRWPGAHTFPLTSFLPKRYRVFAPDGTLSGWMETPPNLWPLDLRDDLVLGVEQDELDVIAVSLYRIER